MKVLDRAAFVNINPPRDVSTFGEYCSELTNKVKSTGSGLERVDVVFDIYKDESLSQTRENRGTGIRVSVREGTPVLKNSSSFMINDIKKTAVYDSCL